MPKVKVATQKQSAVELHYEDYGQGKPIVLIHGWPLSGRAWEPQVKPLIDAGYRVITYDRRGFGESDKPWDGYDYDTMAADLKALMDHLDLQDATLVGFSMGGGEVARYIGNYGTERLAGAVFAAAVPPFLYKADDNPDGGLDDETIASFENNVTSDRVDFLHGFSKNFFGTADRSDLISEGNRLYHVQIASFASPKGTLDCIAAFGRTDFRDDLKKVTVPTLVIHGDSDQIVPFEVSGKRTHEAIEGAQLALIEGGPHGLNVTHADQFNKALLDFLS